MGPLSRTKPCGGHFVQDVTPFQLFGFISESNNPTHTIRFKDTTVQLPSLFEVTWQRCHCIAGGFPGQTNIHVSNMFQQGNPLLMDTSKLEGCRESSWERKIPMCFFCNFRKKTGGLTHLHKYEIYLKNMKFVWLYVLKRQYEYSKQIQHIYHLLSNNLEKVNHI